MLQQPFKTYNGGKSGNGTYQNIINFIPKCEMFIDALVGNGGIVCNLKLPAHTVINDFSPYIVEKYISYCSNCFQIENMHVLELINKWDSLLVNKFFYFDPPYLKSSRKSQQDLYKIEWSMLDHEKFISRVLTVTSNCMISHYPCNLYDTAFKEWNKFTFQSMTRSGPATECLYMNYPTPTVLQDYRYIGKNFTERQRIKRKATRFLRKLEHLPEQEFNCIIACIIDKFNLKEIR